MTERPILFSAPMVRALLAGTKTQTRRIVKPQPVETEGMGCRRLTFYRKNGNPAGNVAIGTDAISWFSPYGAPGDVLWVKETHRFDFAYDHLKPTQMPDAAAVFYVADDGKVGDGFPGKTRVALHMQRRFSRISLRITDVRVERLNEIDDSDSMAEGIGLADGGGFEVPGMGDDVSPICCQPTARRAYRFLWEHINGPGSWAANPWVWAVSFERLP